MNADRQIVARGGGVDRPVGPAAERHLAHGEHQHLDEAAVGGAALDLLDRELRVLQRHHDRGAKRRLGVEPFPGDPVVDGAGEGFRHVIVEHQLDAVEAVADREADAEVVEQVRAHRPDVARRLPGFARASPGAP